MAVSVEFLAATTVALKSTIVSMNTVTEIKCNKKSRVSGVSFDSAFKGPVFKAAKLVGNVGISYENSVNNQRMREEINADFEAESLPWGEFYCGSKNVITHKGEFYLRYYPSMGITSQYDKSTLIYADGTPLTEAECEIINEYTATPHTSSRQGTEKEIKVRTIKMSNIKTIKINGVEMEIDPSL